MEYWQHETYGKEDRTNKVVTIILDSAPLPGLIALFEKNNPPYLDEKFPTLEYCGGHGDYGRDPELCGFGNDWEKTNTCPRGLIGYNFDGNKITLWATEAISRDLFESALRYTLEQALRSAAYNNARVTGIDTQGLAVSFSGSSLQDVATTIRVSRSRKQNRPQPSP